MSDLSVAIHSFVPAFAAIGILVITTFLLKVRLLFKNCRPFVFFL